MLNLNRLQDYHRNLLADICEDWILAQHDMIEAFPNEDHNLRRSRMAEATRLSEMLDSSLTPYTVHALYVDTMQPYSDYVFAHSPEAAVRRAFKRCCENNDFPTEGIDFKGDSLMDLSDKVDLQITGVVEGHHEEQLPDFL